MKKCTWCGKEYPDDATTCAIDERALVLVGSQGTDAHEDGSHNPATSISGSAAHAAARKNMLVGALCVFGGIVVTVVTYGLASNRPNGGSFIVASGAIIFGARQFIRGMSAANASSMGHDSPNPQRDAASLLDEAARLESVDFHKAISAYEEVIHQYPDTRASKEAASAVEVLKRSV